MTSDRVHEVRIVNVRLKQTERPKLTDHAMARYLSRVLGVKEINGNKIRAARLGLTSRAVDMAIARGESVAVMDGFKVVLDGRVVVTVLTSTMEVKEDAQGQRKTRLALLSELNHQHPLGETS